MEYGKKAGDKILVITVWAGQGSQHYPEGKDVAKCLTKIPSMEELRIK